MGGMERGVHDGHEEHAGGRVALVGLPRRSLLTGRCDACAVERMRGRADRKSQVCRWRAGTA